MREGERGERGRETSTRNTHLIPGSLDLLRQLVFVRPLLDPFLADQLRLVYRRLVGGHHQNVAIVIGLGEGDRVAAPPFQIGLILVIVEAATISSEYIGGDVIR